MSLKPAPSVLVFELVIGDFSQVEASELFGAIFQYPSMLGDADDLSQIIDQLHAQKAIAIVAADLMSLALLKPPGEMGCRCVYWAVLSV